MTVRVRSWRGEVPGLKMRLVYAALIGAYGRPLTQSEVVRFLGMKRSTVSDYAKDLEDGRFIRRRDGRKTNVLYRKDRMHGIIDCYLEDDMKAAKTGNVQVVTGPARILPLREHSPGGWITIRAEKEGFIGEYPVPSPIGGTVMQRLFGDILPSRMKGLDQWTGSIIGDSGAYRIRYQKGVNTGSMTFGIIPPGNITTSKRCLDAEAEGRDTFYGKVAVLLMELEKRAGWIFGKDALGNYAIRDNCPREYAFGPELTEAARECLGDGFGSPGVSVFWLDDSDTAMGGNGEFETNSITHADALTDLPMLFTRVRRLEKGQEIMVGEIERMREGRCDDE